MDMNYIDEVHYISNYDINDCNNKIIIHDNDSKINHTNNKQKYQHEESSHYNISLLVNNHNSHKSNDKLLGTWIFDKKNKKRKYRKIYTGAEAIRKSRFDQQCENHPMKTCKYELKYLISMVNIPNILQLLTCQSKDIDPYNVILLLKTWGIPEKVILKYNYLKVTSLFPWQIECLTVDEGQVLTKYHNLVYSAPTSGGKTLVAELLMLRQLAKYIQSPNDHNDNNNNDILTKDGSNISNSSTTNNANVKSKVQRHTIFFVVPFVALAEEKASHFQDIWSDMNIVRYLPIMTRIIFIQPEGVKAFHGDGSDCTGNVLTEDIEVAVCTIERANILLTQLLDEGREDQLKMVVIDEIHMLSDVHRGFLLEVMLSKVKYLLKNQVQIIGMSATLPNIRDLAQWLDASLYTTQYRPVDLEVKVCLHRNLYKCIRTPRKDIAFEGEIQTCMEGLDSIDNIHMKETNMNYNEDQLKSCDGSYEFILERKLDDIPNDPDGLKKLCFETMSIKKSVLLFCNTKKRCEICASTIAESASLIGPTSSNTSLHTLIHNNSLHPFHKETSSTATIVTTSSTTGLLTKDEKDYLNVLQGRSSLLEALNQTQVGLCPVLKDTIPHGIAYHHSGLTLDERKLIEEAFRNGIIQLLCTTSTLSAGVNLPAHRVILRTPYMGDSSITVAGFRQMCGRAGRMGLDSKGEAILMISTSKIEEKMAVKLLTADIDPLFSTLHIGTGGGLEKLLLEMISCRKLTHELQVLPFISCTLMNTQQNIESVKSFTTKALLFLKKEQFIQSLASTGELSPSPLGLATTLSGMSPKDAVLILQPLLDARQKLILKGGLHPVYLVTPPSTTIEPDWKNYEKILHLLYQEQPDAQQVANYLGIDPGQICHYAYNIPSRNQNTPQIQMYRRFFSAVLLFSLIQEWPIISVTRIITTVSRGQLHQLQKDAAVFCGMTVVFCKKLNWPILASCLDDFSSRLNFGVHKDILPLVRLGHELTPSRARILFKHGIETAQDILHMGIKPLIDLLIETLPYDGKDPMMMIQNNILNDNEGELDVSSKSKEFGLMICERLAKKIMTRAKEYLVQESLRLNTGNI